MLVIRWSGGDPLKRLRLLALTLVGISCAYVHCAAQLAMSDGDALAAIRVVPFEAEFRATRAAAEAGSVEHQVRLGKLYEQALGVEQNLPAAIVWYRRAAEAGSAAAALALGKVLQNEDLPADRGEAPEPWLRRAAEMGLADAQVGLAWFLRRNGPANQRQESDEWMERAARQGYPSAKMWAGVKLVDSNDAVDRTRGADFLSEAKNLDPRFKFWVQIVEISKNPKRADARRAGPLAITDALHQSAMSIDLEEQTDVGNPGFSALVVIMALSRMDVDLRRSEEQAAAARDNLQIAAEAGDVQAACNLGFLQTALKNHASAFEAYRKAALRGSARAAYHLGVFYRDGLGVDIDASNAALWFYRSAIQMYPPAQAALGDLLLNGKGVATDIRAAIAWLRPAAAYGNPLAQYDLGLTYDRGLGVEVDRERGLMLIASAAVGRDFPTQQLSEISWRKGLPAAQDWLKSAEADPQRGEAVRRAIDQARRIADQPALNSAPTDCLGRERVF
jgi:TPR repeat protein